MTRKIDGLFEKFYKTICLYENLDGESFIILLLGKIRVLSFNNTYFFILKLQIV